MESQAQGPQARTTSLADVVRRAARSCDLAELMLLIAEVGLPSEAARRGRRLVTLGRYLLELDLEDLDRSARTFPELADRIRGVSLPVTANAEHRGMLASLVPAMELLLEVVNVSWERHDMASLLATVHLMGEYLSLAAWEPVLGHAADPVRLLPIVSTAGSRWGRPDCPASGAQRSACGSMHGALTWPQGWERYLDSDHAYVAEVLARCATCAVACAVRDTVPEAERRALRGRVSLAGDLAHGRLLKVRHASPVGHSFSLPDRGDLMAVWERDWKQLVGRHGRLLTDRAESSSCLPGLDTAVSAACGAPVRPGTLLHDVVSELQDALLAHLDEGVSA